jgi:hypothetical protein
MNQAPQNLTPEERTRHDLLQLLNGRNAHMDIADATANFPVEHINSRPPNVPYTFWHLVEHLRLAQADILEFIVDARYEAPAWPEDYWPAPDTRASEEEWLQSLAAFATDQAQLAALVQDPQTDLTAELPHAPGYTIFREILLVADHNAYHVGELAILRQVMGLWPAVTSDVL